MRTSMAQGNYVVRTPTVPNIIGVDPGGTCGVALYNARGFTSFHTPGTHAGRFITERARRLSTLEHVFIACQRFIIVGGAQTQQPDALHIIGELEAFARAENQATVTLELQNSADAARAGSREILQSVGWWKPGYEHANDAARHVALTMLRHFPARWWELTPRVD